MLKAYPTSRDLDALASKKGSSEKRCCKPAEDVRINHEVKLMDFTKWLGRTGGSPREVSDRHRIRSILGMQVSRQKAGDPGESR